jgi:hypothetical protein
MVNNVAVVDCDELVFREPELIKSGYLSDLGDQQE